MQTITASVERSKAARQVKTARKRMAKNDRSELVTKRVWLWLSINECELRARQMSNRRSQRALRELHGMRQEYGILCNKYYFVDGTDYEVLFTEYSVNRGSSSIPLQFRHALVLCTVRLPG